MLQIISANYILNVSSCLINIRICCTICSASPVINECINPTTGTVEWNVPLLCFLLVDCSCHSWWWSVTTNTLLCWSTDLSVCVCAHGAQKVSVCCCLRLEASVISLAPIKALLPQSDTCPHSSEVKVKDASHQLAPTHLCHVVILQLGCRDSLCCPLIVMVEILIVLPSVSAFVVRS